MRWLMLTALVATVGWPGCSKVHPEAGTAPDAKTEPHRDEATHPALPTKVRLPSGVAESAKLQISPTRMEALPLTVSLPGEIVADPDRSAQVSARVSGRLVAVHFKEGARVKRGALLAVVEAPEAGRARAAARAGQARSAASRHNADRLKSLEEKGLAAPQELRAAEAEATAAEAEAASARDTLRAFGAAAVENGTARLEVRAPLDGTVLSRNAVVGQAVAASDLLAVIADLDEAYFMGRLFEKDLARAQEGAAAEVRLNAYPGQVFTGTVESIGKQLDIGARAVIARVRVKDTQGRLKIGLFGSALVEELGTHSSEKRLVVPLSAVTQVLGREVLFVRHPDGEFELHPVSLGRTANGRVEVLHGLREGEEVVVEGVFTLKSAVLKSSFADEEAP